MAYLVLTDRRTAHFLFILKILQTIMQETRRLRQEDENVVFAGSTAIE
jgi:hypothetical protein